MVSNNTMFITGFDAGMWSIVDDYPDGLWGLDAVGDFIVELVHEIERLQTENIDMRNTLHYVDHATWGWENVGYYGPYND
jgi:hypothetical protein